MITIDTTPFADPTTSIPNRFRELAALEHELDALIHYGTPETLERIRRLAAHPSPSLAKRARFAEALIGHRLGADYGVEQPDSPRDPVPDRFRIPLEVRPAGPEDRRQLSSELAAGSYGVAPALQHAVRLDSDEEAWLIVPDGRFCYRQKLERLNTTRALLGVVAEHSQPAGFAPALLILTTPAHDGEGAHVHLHDPDGTLIHGGRLRVEDGVAWFTFGGLCSGTDAEGATPLEIEGRLSEDGLQLTEAWTAVGATHTDVLRMVKATPARRE